jgi:hypothetical protein
MKTPKVKGRRSDQNESNDKALQRLHQFEEERGLQPTQPAGTTVDRPKGSGPKTGRLKRKRR